MLSIKGKLDFPKFKVQSVEMGFLCRMAGLSLRDKEELHHPRGNVELLLLLIQKRSIKNTSSVQASDYNASWTPSLEGLQSLRGDSRAHPIFRVCVSCLT